MPQSTPSSSQEGQTLRVPGPEALVPLSSVFSIFQLGSGGMEEGILKAWGPSFP